MTKLKRKRVIVFSFEGKNNKTESLYFSHYKPKDDDYILKTFSSGVTDPKGMINSTKNKRKQYDYNPNEDLTFIFMDGDNSNRYKQIKCLKENLPKDIKIIATNPSFELWFLNHFISTTKEYTNEQLINELKRYVSDYTKNMDIQPIISEYECKAIINSNHQLKQKKDNPRTEVVELFNKEILKRK